MQCPVMQQETVITINGHFFTSFRMNNEHAHQTNGQLHHLIGMRVIHVCSVLTQGKFIGVGLARFDMRLAQPAHTVHT